MAKHVVGKAEDVGPGMRKVFEVSGPPIVNVDGDYFALLNRCPHQSAELSKGLISGIATADEPERVQCSRRGEFAAPGMAGNSIFAPASPDVIRRVL